MPGHPSRFSFWLPLDGIAIAVAGGPIIFSMVVVSKGTHASFSWNAAPNLSMLFIQHPLLGSRVSLGVRNPLCGCPCTVPASQTEQCRDA